jgi:hypothetical protein
MSVDLNEIAIYILIITFIFYLIYLEIFCHKMFFQNIIFNIHILVIYWTCHIF